MRNHVILLHGIWMRGFTLALLARRLRAAGHEVSVFDYASVTDSPERSVQRVFDYAQSLPEESSLSLVGHSLGGLLALRVAEAMPGRCRRVVCLGTPLNGSAAARVLARYMPLRWTLGEARAWLCDGVLHWSDALDVAMIAGRLPIGFGTLVPGMDHPCDGTVALAETRHSQLAAHAVVGTSHGGLLLSRQVAAMTACYLDSGRLHDEPLPASASAR